MDIIEFIELPKHTMLMNIYTGSIDTKSNWLCDYQDADIHERGTLDKWVGSLVVVGSRQEL